MYTLLCGGLTEGEGSQSRIHIIVFYKLSRKFWSANCKRTEDSQASDSLGLYLNSSVSGTSGPASPGMPKKHAPKFAYTKPSYVHPSLQSSRAPTAPGTPAPRTVNERIQQLRREAAPRASSERRDEVTEVVTKRTVPPTLRRLLQMPEVDVPRPKPGSRAARVSRTDRPPPGPAPPSSWLHDSRHAPDHIRKLTAAGRSQGEHRVSQSRLGLLARVYYGAFQVSYCWWQHAVIKV